MAVTTISSSSSAFFRRCSFSFQKPTTLCCFKCLPLSTTTTFSSSSYPRPSQSHRWHIPLRRRRCSDASPEILRHWVESNLPLPSRETFTVVSYNILGDKNASKHRYLYSRNSLDYIAWEYRKEVLCEELIGWNPDIICLQEVDKYLDVASIMVKAGYSGSYKRRTGDSVDGCAMFWRTDKFRLVEEEGVEYKQFGLRDNVAQLAVFEMCKAEVRVLIGNIHVIYNPSRGDVKLGQIRNLSSKASTLSKKWGNIPVLLAGDFNIIPQSPIYKYLSSAKLNIRLHDRRELSGQRYCHPDHVFGSEWQVRSPFQFMDRLLKHCWTDEEVQAATGKAGDYLCVHPLKLNSSYATLKGPSSTRDSSGEPLATSYHKKFLGTVDYLWYSEGLVPARVLDTLPIDTLQIVGGLPHKGLGSDHLALVCEFAFTLKGIDDGYSQDNEKA